MEFGGLGKEIPHDLACPQCQVGRLHRHDDFLRPFEGKQIRINVLRCSKCGKSQACLFDFLVPCSADTPEALGEQAARYLTEEKSYEQAGWESSQEEGEGQRSQIFRVIESLCRKHNWIVAYLEKLQLKPAESLWKRKEPEPEEECPNAHKARSPEKRKRLNQLRAALGRYMRMSGVAMAAAIAALQQAAMLLTAPFSLLTRTEVRRLSAPKKVRYGSM